MIGAFRGTPLEIDMRSVMRKVQAQLEGKVTIDPASFTGNMSVLSEDYVQLDPEIWTRVARSIDRQEQLCAAYTKFDGTRGSYTPSIPISWLPTTGTGTWSAIITAAARLLPLLSRESRRQPGPARASRFRRILIRPPGSGRPSASPAGRSPSGCAFYSLRRWPPTFAGAGGTRRRK